MERSEHFTDAHDRVPPLSCCCFRLLGGFWFDLLFAIENYSIYNLFVSNASVWIVFRLESENAAEMNDVRREDVNIQTRFGHAIKTRWKFVLQMIRRVSIILSAFDGFGSSAVQRQRRHRADERSVYALHLFWRHPDWGRPATTVTRRTLSMHNSPALCARLSAFGFRKKREPHSSLSLPPRIFECLLVFPFLCRLCAALEQA